MATALLFDRDRVRALSSYFDAFEALEQDLEEIDAKAMPGEASVMKALTLASVVLLPGALIAGVVGMNVKIGIFENAAYFWVVVAIIATVAVARAREWI